MSGISSVNRNIENRKGGMQSSELILSDDGDFALIAALVDNDDDDSVGDFIRHTYQDEIGNWNFDLCKNTVGDRCDLCDRDIRKQYRFGFWAWVYTLGKKTEGKGEGWNLIQNRSGSYYEREVNDFKLVTLPMGRADNYWNMFYDIYQLGNFENILRIGRKGKGQMDTQWSIISTNKKVDKKDISDRSHLPGVVNYFVQQAESKEDNRPVPLVGGDEDDVPWNVEKEANELF